MICLTTSTSNPTRQTYIDNIRYVKGIKPITVTYVGLDITIEPIVYTSPK